VSDTQARLDAIRAQDRSQMTRGDMSLAIDALAAELERVTAALREIAHYEEPWPQDPSDVYEHFQAVARAALAGGARAAQEGDV
jgi:hypothetical protein